MLLTYSQNQSANKWIENNLSKYFNEEKIIVKSRDSLTKEEKKQIESAIKREFGITIHIEKKGQIIASGGLMESEPVVFNGETYSILAIGGIIANTKRKGYGKQIMTAIRDYLIEKGRTGIGFCAFKNKDFYKKCGFYVDDTSIKRFVFKKKSKKVTNQEDDCVIYLDSLDQFMQYACVLLLKKFENRH